jgi:protein-tyrosine phosphatase
MQPEMCPPVRTSDTHPLYIDLIPTETALVLGRIGITFAPGKHQPNANGNWERDLDKDLSRLRDHWHADVLVSLLEQQEFEQLRIPNLITRARDHDIEVIWLPIRDRSIPLSMVEFHQLVTTINDQLHAGKNVVVQCMAGLGRAVVVVASCLMVLLDKNPQETIAIIRTFRENAYIEPAQEEFLHLYYRYALEQSHW